MLVGRERRKLKSRKWVLRVDSRTGKGHVSKQDLSHCPSQLVNPLLPLRLREVMHFLDPGDHPPGDGGPARWRVVSVAEGRKTPRCAGMGSLYVHFLLICSCF